MSLQQESEVAGRKFAKEYGDALLLTIPPGNLLSKTHRAQIEADAEAAFSAAPKGSLSVEHWLNAARGDFYQRVKQLANLARSR